jgi:hypothetical protein
VLLAFNDVVLLVICVMATDAATVGTLVGDGVGALVGALVGVLVCGAFVGV